MAKDIIKILHLGDFHLDSPFAGLPIDKSEERRRGARSLFSLIMRYVRETQVDILLIPGDLFDSDYATSDTAELLVREFASSHECKIVIAPGNHDPYSPTGIYAQGRLPRNVHVFRSEALASLAFDDLGVAVHGWAFTSASHGFSPLADAPACKNDGRLHLVCGHCDLDAPLSKYCPVTTRDLERFGAHYAALAHRHIHTDILRAGTCAYSYCGCPEGRSFDEPGIGGAYLVTAHTAGGTPRLEFERLAFGRRRYATETVDISGAATGADAARLIRDLVNAKHYGEETSLRIVLTGSVSPTFRFPEKISAQAMGLAHIEVRDNTAPTYDSAYLERDMTVRGELYRYLRHDLTEGTPEERELAAKALTIGLAAIDGRDITQ